MKRQTLAFFWLLVVTVGVGALFLLGHRFEKPTDKKLTEPSVSDVLLSAGPRALRAAGQTQSGSSDAVIAGQEVREKLAVIDEVFRTHQDNDPRLDTELRSLSPVVREAFRRKYQELPAERRNERGTIVFLLGRNLNGPADFAFMERVLQEPPCRSLANCARDPGKEEEGHVDLGVDLTLHYPQIMALKAMERILKDARGDEMRRKLARFSLEAARQAIDERIRRMAAELEGRFPK